jgi:replicative DNA helicase
MANDLLQQLQSILSDKTFEEKEIIERLKETLLGHEVACCITRDSKSLADLFDETISDFQENSNPTHLINTGFNNLDKLIGGFYPGELVVVGGRPSMGKTQLCVNMALHMAVTSPLLYFTFDLSSSLLACRFYSALSGIPAERIIQHDLTTKENNHLLSQTGSPALQNVFINDSCSVSISALKAQCIRQIRENGVKIIVVDYLQMMSSVRYRNSRELEISYISRELKSLARDHNICVIATSQLSRAPEKRSAAAKPILSDLRESGAIEQDADKVILMYRPAYYAIDVDEEGNSTKGAIELIVAKNRNGRLGSAALYHHSNFTTFSDIPSALNQFSFSADRLKEIEETPF